MPTLSEIFSSIKECQQDRNPAATESLPDGYETEFAEQLDSIFEWEE